MKSGIPLMTGSLMEISQATRDKGTRLLLQEHLMILSASCQTMKLLQCCIQKVFCCWTNIKQKPNEVEVVAVGFEQ